MTICMLLQACAPAIPRQQADSEIGAFMLDFVLRHVISGTGNTTQTAGQPWEDAPFESDIIVWGPPEGTIGTSSGAYLRADAPYHVWWLANNQLTEVTSDKAAAIQDYRKTHMQAADPSQDAWAWGYYEFGILSISDGNRKARVYVGASCGPLCGTGMTYNLERDKDGQWRVKGLEMQWIS